MPKRKKPPRKKVRRAKSEGPASSYDSIGAAAAGLGVAVSVLRKAKRAGAPGFRGSRVYPAELLPWLNSSTLQPFNPSTLQDKDALERQFLKVKIERLEFAFAVDRKEFIRAADAASWATEMVTEFAKVLDGIPSTLAPDIVGCGSVAEAELRIRSALDRAKAMLHEGPWKTI